MADLSHLLGAVYGDGQPDPDGPPVPVEPPAADRVPATPEPPDWADDAHLDAAFAGWTPGPPDEAPAAERALVADVRPPQSGNALDDDIAAALSEALVPKREAAAELAAAAAGTDTTQDTDADHIPVDAQEPEPTPQPAPTESVEKAVLLPVPEAPALHVARVWQRSDDDILPHRKGKGLRISLPLRRG